MVIYGRIYFSLQATILQAVTRYKTLTARPGITIIKNDPNTSGPIRSPAFTPRVGLPRRFIITSNNTSTYKITVAVAKNTYLVNWISNLCFGLWPVSRCSECCRPLSKHHCCCTWVPWDRSAAADAVEI